MSSSEWGGLTPERVADWINFDRNDPAWHYARCERISMPARQAEGVAGLWNKLAQHNLALLADEVGMGKTFQALGVMALLWKRKPQARVLIMAPNRDICLHWAREYRSFLRDHYRAADHLSAPGSGEAPAQPPAVHSTLASLVDAVGASPERFYLTTIHSLSRLVADQDNLPGNVLDAVQREAQSVHAALKAQLGDQGFDLIVVDEAHYFRNADGGSQRARAAQHFFGEPCSPLGQKVLLLTATPSHSSLHDVPNILGYFADLASGECLQTPAQLLEKYALRRLRLMQGLEGRHHSKYNYRHEQAIAASFESNPEAEMFFALYQKKLTQEVGAQGNNRRFLYGYLEGFESIGATPDDEAQAPAEDGEQERPRNAFVGAPDTQILHNLTQLHFQHFDHYPQHPKYGALVNACLPQQLFAAGSPLHEHKHLVFVRRIASVREVTQRLNAAYDRLLARHIVHAWAPADEQQFFKRWEKSRWSRYEFNQWVKQQQTGETDPDELADDQDDAGADPSTDNEEKLASFIADLFVVKKTGKERSTDCSKFSLRLRKPQSLFCLLLEPASDYRNQGYDFHYREHGSGRDRDNYAAAARDRRLSGQGVTLNAPGLEQIKYSNNMPTLWGLLYDLLPDASRQRLDGWVLGEKADWRIAENFGNYLKAGFVFASPVIVELYAWFTEFRRKPGGGTAQQRYLKFIEWLELLLPGSLLYQYFVAALDSFEPLCEKIIDHGLADLGKDWRMLTSLQSPAWYASGETHNRQRLILGFNSPFYPNVLVATSVFQEGVNLHLQCRKVHHYGIAWTPGDNEQRVGRVDRLFGRVNQQLQEQGQAELAIHYPYLTRSFDQEQLASFVQLKHGVEARMDACQYTSFNDQIDIRLASDTWTQYLRKPLADVHVDDPFPASFEPQDIPHPPYKA